MRKLRLPGFLLAVPAWLWLLAFFVAPVLVVFWYSFGFKPGLFGTHANDVLSFDRYAEVLTGTTLAHTDVRDDNVIVPPHGVVFCDWNWPICAIEAL